MGTPDFAVPSLEVTAELCDLVGVVAQPDRPRGRGQRSAPPPTAAWARERGVHVSQPATLRRPEAVSEIAALAPDVIVVAAYGKILPRELLALPRLGCINVHASLLPRYRGAAPIQWAIARGETETGVTIMQMDEGLDTGPMLLQRACPIAPGDTGATLGEKLARLGAEALHEALPRLERGELHGVAQDAALATLAPRLTREDAQIDWSLPASALHDRIRAFQPWPGARCVLPDGLALKILATEVDAGEGAPGTVLAADRSGIRVATGRGALRLLEVQPEGGRRMAAGAFVAGHPLERGQRLGG